MAGKVTLWWFVSGDKLTPEVMELEGTLEQIEKGGYKHFMIKEIMEQPTSLENCMRGRVKLTRSNPPSPNLKGVSEPPQIIVENINLGGIEVVS